MDIVGVTANVIAVADLSAKIATLLFQYSTAVAHARADIKLLYEQSQGLEKTLQQASRLIEEPSSQSLTASRELGDQLKACRDELDRLRGKLEPGTPRRAMRRFGLRALKWPFTSKETEVIMVILQRHQHNIAFSLQIDQTSLLLGIHKGMESLSLQPNEDASINRMPHFNVPFPQDPDFIQRPAIQSWVRRQYASLVSRMALVGLGGFGKSQVAIEFAYEVHCTSPDTSVFWVHGSTKARFEESYRYLADTLALPRRHDPTVNILALVRDWLQSNEVAPWLMVLDNADNIQTFFGNTKATLVASYLPKAGHGKILITSRNLNVAEKLTGSHNAIIQVATMDSAQAQQLFQKKLNPILDRDMAADLVDALDFVPLAVSQAAAYINRRSPRVSTQSYLNSFWESEKEKTSLLNFDAGDLRRHEGVSNSVVVTWQVTFEQILQERQSAANLLSLMSFFHPQSIPEYMLSGYTKALVDDSDEDECDNCFEEDLDILRAYSLVSMSTIPGFCDMHSLIQFCTQRWLSAHDVVSRWKRLFLQLASTYFPTGEFDTWADGQILLPHIQTLLYEQPSDEADILKWTSLLTSASWYLFKTGDYFKAERIAQLCLEVRKTKLAVDHPDMLTSISKLASIFRNKGRWDEAEQLDMQVLETSKTKLGVNHPDTLTSMANLASTYWHQGRWEEAEKLQIQIMETCKSKLGTDHPDTLTSRANLALIFQNQGRWKKAEKLSIQVIETRKTKLGVDHPDTLTSIANLASTFQNQGRWEEAEELFIQVIETRKTKLGLNHPNTLISMANLASIYWNQGRLEKAEELFIQVIETRKSKLGVDHPNTLTSIANLASMFRNQGRWEEAEKLEVQVMETSKTKLGVDHPNTLTSVANLASTYWNQGRLEKAEELFMQVIETRKAKLGVDHPDTVTSIANLALIYWNRGQWEDAEKLEVQVMEICKTKLGADHPNTLMSMNNLAHTWQNMGKKSEAINLMRECVDLRKLRLGLSNPNTESSISSLNEWLREK